MRHRMGLAIGASILFVLCGSVLYYLQPLKEIPSEPDEFSWAKLVPSKKLVWNDCFPRRQCARLIVPLDHSDPNGPEAVIAITRRPSLFPPDSKFYRGPVIFNPGGPGGSGVDMILDEEGDLLSVIIGPEYDVVGFDPRGIARSTPRASFFKTPVERNLWGEGFVTINNSDEGIARTWARSRVAAELAADTDFGYLRHINTEQTARDMLRIVEAHGRSKLLYWGFSYGSVLGATFAVLFPDKVERLIFDGVVDAENYYSTLWTHNLLDTDKVLGSFFEGCAEAGPDGCPFWAPTAENIRQNLTSLYQSIRSQPIPVKTEESYGIVDYSMLRTEVFFSLYRPYFRFPILAQILADLAAGNGTSILEMNPGPSTECSCDPSDGMFDNVYDSQTAILCNDGDEVPEDLKSSEEYFESLAKLTEWADIWGALRLSCVGWPEFPKDHFQGPFEANTSHPILFIGNTADPVTPLWAAHKMSRGFTGSVVLTQNSVGHSSSSAPSLCTQKYVREYLLYGTLPEPGTVCQPIGKPFPKVHSILDRREDPSHGAGQSALLMDLSENEKEILDALSMLSKRPTQSFPFHQKFRR